MGTTKKITFQQFARDCKRKKDPPAHPWFLCRTLQNKISFSNSPVNIRNMQDDRCCKKNCPVWARLEDV